MAKTVPRTTEIHGERLVDDYHWLREKENPDVRAYLEAENAYTDAVMKPTEGFQQALYAEMLGRIQETDENVPYRRGGFFYYSRTEQGKQYPIHCRKKGSLEAAEEVTLDLNRLAEGKAFMSLGAYQVSDDGKPPRLRDRRHRLPPVHAVRQGPARGRAPRRRSRRRSARWPGPPTAGRSSTPSRKSPRSGSTGSTAIASGRPRTTSSTRRRTRRSTSASTARGACSTSSSASASLTTSEARFLPAGGAARRVAARGSARSPSTSTTSTTTATSSTSARTTAAGTSAW